MQHQKSMKLKNSQVNVEVNPSKEVVFEKVAVEVKDHRLCFKVKEFASPEHILLQTKFARIGPLAMLVLAGWLLQKDSVCLFFFNFFTGSTGSAKLKACGQHFPARCRAPPAFPFLPPQTSRIFWLFGAPH